MKFKAKRVLGIFLGTFFFISIMAFPQIRESGAIQGHITDKGKVPLPGVTVALTGTNLIGGAKNFVTDSKGFYRFPSIPPGPYIVTAEIAGFGKSSREGIRVHNGLNLTVDFVLEEAKLAMEVMVVGLAPTIDVRSSSTGTVILTNDLLLGLPSGKNMMDIINLAPGVDYYGAFGTGYGSPNTYQIDGISTRSPGWGGSMVEPDFNIVEESSVQSFGLGAEYGEFTGVVFNTITKSGSNKYEGLAEIRYNDKTWNSQNLVDVPSEKLLNPAAKNNKQLSNRMYDIGLQFGGPILKDKLWFFASGEYYNVKSYPVGTTRILSSYSPKFFAKFNYSVNQANRVNFVFNYDAEQANGILSSMAYSPEVNLDNDFPGFFASANWTSTFSANTYLDVKFGYNYKKQAQMPSAGRDISGRYDVVLGKYTKNYSSFFYNSGSVLDLSAHLSHYITDFMGSHDIKIGIENQNSVSGQKGGYNGTDHTYYQDQNGQPYLQYQYDRDWDFTHYFNVFVGFLQDSWSVTDKLTVNLGVRLNNYWYNIPSPGPGTVFKDTAIAPRIGLAYDLFGDRKNVVKFHYGVYFDPVYRTYFQNAETRRPDQVQRRWDGTQYVEYNRVVFSSQYKVDPNTKQPYTQEIMAGYERELFKDASLGVTFFYKSLARAIGSVNTMGTYEKRNIVNPGPDGVAGTSDDSRIDVWNQTNPGKNSYLITNPKKGLAQAMVEEPEHYSTGLELLFNKRMSNRWQLMASYTYLVAKGNIARPPVFDLGMDPNRFTNAGGTNVSYTGQPHILKLQTNILLPFDINLGVNASYISPLSFRPYFTTFLDQGSVTVYAKPFGENLVDPQKNVDLRLEKRVDIKGSKVTIFGDVFNIFNGHETRWDYDVFGGYGANFGKISSIRGPRTFRIGFRIIY